MKNKYSSIQILFIVLCLLIQFSCNDVFLTKEPPGVAAGSIIQSQSGVEALLVGAYSTLQGFGRFGGDPATDWTYGSGASDEAYKGSSAGDQTNFNAVERFECLPSNGYMAERWRDCYNGVARSNQVIDFLKATQAGANKIPDARAKQIEAEAKFLRAWFHFKANRVFRNIPYVKTESELGKPVIEIPNTDAGWTDMEADIQFAIDNLPETFPSEPGRATKNAALALKAWVFMNENKLASAKALLDAIISNPKFSLVSNYYDNYNEATENNKESIFEIQAQTSSVNQSAMLVAGPSMHQAGPAAIGWGFYQPSQVLVETFQVQGSGLPILNVADRPALKSDMMVLSKTAFEPTAQLVDPRLDWTVSRRGIDFLGWGICQGASWIRDQSNGGPYMSKKYMHLFTNKALQTNGSGFDNNRNFRAIRLAHVLLWRAECAIADNDLAMATTLVNQIRNRAKSSNVVMGLCTTYLLDGSVPFVVDYTKPAANYKVEPYPATFASKDDATKAVQVEWTLEFACEGQRFFNLRRWGTLKEVMNDYISRDTKFRSFLTGATFVGPKNEYWPIPQAQLDIQASLAQDPNHK
ncbi:MAG: RagB/SusD family nutrient uptake outer membrane protein [Mariniphaga sp.]|nr:RagB/SusD family nutrient uptake outer membrane protein [Mariniphaga sp.]